MFPRIDVIVNTYLRIAVNVLKIGNCGIFRRDVSYLKTEEEIV